MNFSVIIIKECCSIVQLPLLQYYDTLCYNLEKWLHNPSLNFLVDT